MTLAMPMSICLLGYLVSQKGIKNQETNAETAAMEENTNVPAHDMIAEIQKKEMDGDAFKLIEMLTTIRENGLMTEQEYLEKVEIVLKRL